MMWEAVTVIEAQEQLKQFTVSDWPQLKKAKREETHRSLYRQAYPGSIKEKNYVSPEDFQRIFGG